MSVEVQKGTCKWFDSKKGFGFITAEDGTDLFVHQTEIKANGFRNLKEGEDVEFKVQTAPDGKKKAVHVTGPNGSSVRGEGESRRIGASGYSGERRWGYPSNYGGSNYSRNGAYNGYDVNGGFGGGRFAGEDVGRYNF